MKKINYFDWFSKKFAYLRTIKQIVWNHIKKHIIFSVGKLTDPTFAAAQEEEMLESNTRISHENDLKTITAPEDIPPTQIVKGETPNLSSSTHHLFSSDTDTGKCLKRSWF